MRFERLRLRNFKPYADADLTLRDGVTVIHGLNGSGKSSLLEACFFALYGARALDDTLDEIVTTGADGVTQSSLVTGIPANFARESLVREGVIAPDGTPLHEGALDIASWKTVWSMGHGCGGVSAVRPAEEVIAGMAKEWRAARQMARSRPAQ